MSVGGRSMLRVMGQLRLYLLPTGLAPARMDVRALSVVMMPALAIETVCCSCRGMACQPSYLARRGCEKEDQP